MHTPKPVARNRYEAALAVIRSTDVTRTLTNVGIEHQYDAGNLKDAVNEYEVFTKTAREHEAQDRLNAHVTALLES